MVLPPGIPVKGVCYVSGPVSGRPDGNRARFAEAAALLRAEGWVVLNPREHPLSDECAAESARLGERYREGPLYRQLMRDAFGMVLCSERLFMLPRWYESSGARGEAMVAQMTGAPMYAWHPEPERRQPFGWIDFGGPSDLSDGMLAA